ncbi:MULTISPECIES: hypothetical protein [Enterococcus]|jgi:hypothetical protein|uniref:Uncharacterized protein n=1 Tax=Enterococcus mundtii TaxID=53346 RepID=A0A1V2UCG2_ENTMU|nr:hypothetical protein [Enterococcus mundtii]AZP91631.1 hypothetical protein CYK55_00115 [Enterococcus mundtii]ONN40982.1 hypothetical protein BTN92_14120 [Enterococcus mundtii]QCJ57880.1 hypothetical protein DDJ96_14900 [Enterococcus mundtii]
MEQKEVYCQIKKKHCQVFKAGHTSKFVDKGEYYLGIEYRIFNSGAVDIHNLRSGKGIEILETGELFDVRKIHKSKKNVLLFLKKPELLLNF